jgi:opacity protein-like surface antigen
MQHRRLPRIVHGLCWVALASSLSSCEILAYLTQQQVYVAVAAGQTEVDSESGEDDSGSGSLQSLGGAPPPRARVDETDTGYGIGLGCNVHKYAAVEIGYQDLGTETYVDIDAASNVFDGEVDTDGYYLTAIGRYPLSELSDNELLGRIEAIGRLGLFMWEQEDDGVAVNTNFPYSESDDGTDLTYGVGLQGRLWSGLSARIEYDYITEIKFTNLWFGLMWTF